MSGTWSKTSRERGQFKRISRECMSETGLKTDTEMDSKEYKCFISCTMRKSKLMADDGTINPDAVIEFSPKRIRNNPQRLETLKTDIEQCQQQVESQTDICQKAYDFRKCCVEQFQKGIKGVLRTCMNETGFNQKTSARDSKEAKCFMSCMMIKSRMMSEDGKINERLASKQFEKRLKVIPNSQEAAKDVLNTCTKEALSQPDNCERAMKFQVCSSEKLIEMRTGTSPKLLEECKQETGYTKAIYARNSREIKCLMACIMKKRKFVNADGAIQVDEIFIQYKTRVPDESKHAALKKVIETCASETSSISDECEKAFSFKRCGHKNSIKAGIVKKRGPPGPPGPSGSPGAA